MLRQSLRQLFFRFFSFFCGRSAADAEHATMRTVAIFQVFFNAREEAAGDLVRVARASCNIGNSYLNIGEYERARKLLEQGRAMAEKLVDRDQVATTCDTYA